jgi:hypothetical protein
MMSDSLQRGERGTRPSKHFGIFGCFRLQKYENTYGKTLTEAGQKNVVQSLQYFQ